MFLSLMLVWTWLPGCGDKDTSKDESKIRPLANATDMSTKSTPGSVKPVQLAADMIANIKIEELTEKPIPLVLTATGKVQFNEDQVARITAPLSGQALQVKVKIGDAVRKGETLFFINSREAAAAITEHVETHRDLDLSEKTYLMTKDLFEHQAASRIALQQAESDFAKAKIRVARTEETLRLFGLHVGDGVLPKELNARIPVRTPIGGTVIERKVTEGQFVQPDPNPLLVIGDLSNVWVLADVFERDLKRVKLGQRAEVKTAAYPDETFVAKVAYIGDVMDPATRTVKVRFLVPNPASRLKPEMFTTVSLLIDESTKGLVLPGGAVFTEDGRSFVYVAVGERDFARRQVETSTDESGRVRVMSGLKSGDKVVADGGLLLRQLEQQRERG
jgi:cobalt-zinc-cadmium efflux system membrane fusion protein